MKVIKLESEITKHLKEAQEVNIAVAIMTNYGFELLKENLPDNCNVNLLIGIDLLTPVTLFQDLHDHTNPNWSVKVFRKKGFFHTKLYLINSGSEKAYIGSGNFTEGGISKHIELFCKIEDEEVVEYQQWFDTYFNLGETLDQDFINDYKPLFNRAIESQSNARNQLNKLKRDILGETEDSLNLNELDFKNQFFKFEHHNAFTGSKPLSTDVEVDQERLEVRKKLYQLHDLLYPKIEERNWELYQHEYNEYQVSSYKHGAYTTEDLHALWLHYGRSPDDIAKFKNLYGDRQTSMYQMRLQVLVHAYDVSTWLTVGKDNGSVIDRTNFKSKMKDEDYREAFFELVKSLPDEYYILINDVYRDTSEFNTADELHDFVKQDNIHHNYFIIGRSYSPDDGAISENNIVNTILNDFELLYPIYLHIRTII